MSWRPRSAKELQQSWFDFIESGLARGKAREKSLCCCLVVFFGGEYYKFTLVSHTFTIYNHSHLKRGPGCHFGASLGLGEVLVHCRLGVNRSVTVVAAFLVRRRGFAPDEALELLSQRRPCADPVSAYREQLRALQPLSIGRTGPDGAK